MGNMYTMRPDLFGAIHCAVPLLDMKRYHMLLAGASWMAEYGDPDTDDWNFLQKYSPYHSKSLYGVHGICRYNWSDMVPSPPLPEIDSKADYPPLLVTTSTRDDRVHPGHARKFVKVSSIESIPFLINCTVPNNWLNFPSWSAQKLWDTGGGKWPVYYYENIEGGHGGAADAKQSAFMSALAHDFCFDILTKNVAAM